MNSIMHNTAKILQIMQSLLKSCAKRFLGAGLFNANDYLLIAA
jgi:hypothetical protein